MDWLPIEFAELLDDTLSNTSFGDVVFKEDLGPFKKDEEYYCVSFNFLDGKITAYCESNKVLKEHEMRLR